MDDDARSNKDESDKVLYSMLSSAFSPADVEVAAVAGTSAVPNTDTSGSLPSPPAEPTSRADDLKGEYEAQVQMWRTQSAGTREKAAKERAFWEEFRALQQKKQEEEAARHKDEGHSSHSIPRAPETADSAGLSGSQKWEDVPSVTSSYPSISFPDGSEEVSPESGPRSAAPPTGGAPASATLTVFDRSLPTRRRLTALFSSLAINLLLPFVNGVMLGFGEIFAKNVVLKWFGWRSPGDTAAVIGIGKAPGSRRS